MPKNVVPHIVLCCALHLSLAGACVAQELSLRNENNSLRFARTDRGFALVDLRCQTPERAFVASGTSPGPMWRLALRPASYDAAAEVVLDSTAPCRLAGSARASGDA